MSTAPPPVAPVVLSPPVPPLDDVVNGGHGNIERLDCPALHWGLLGCGRVSHDFCQALKHVASAVVTACATADDVSRAQQFAALHRIPSAYGTYTDLLADPSVDIIYVGNIHVFRRDIGEQCLLAGKHVLLEKPLACTAEDAAYLMQLAAERNLFLQEGMWTRFFPAVEQARRLVLEQNVLGQVVSVMSDFNFNASDSEVYPDSFFYQRQLGGGASFLVGPYPIATVLLFFGGRAPEQIHVVGQVDAATGVDLQAALTLQFPPTTTTTTTTHSESLLLPGAGVATICYGILGESEEITTVVGTKGRLTIHTPCHCPTQLTVQLKGEGRGTAAQILHYCYPLPADTPDIIETGGYFYPNSAGFCYEAAAVARCIAAANTAGAVKQRCCPQFTLAETLIVQHILHETRQQLHVKTVHDD